jgi:hypothetical protein
MDYRKLKSVTIGARYYRFVLPVHKQSNIFGIKMLISNKSCKHGHVRNCVICDEIYLWLQGGIKQMALSYCGCMHYDTL